MMSKRIVLTCISWFLVNAALVTSSTAAEPTSPQTTIAIDNVCAWPNLELLPNGDILAFVFNQPCHGKWEGDVDCWASSDKGHHWVKRGVPAPHEPGTNRMNIAAGVAHNGDLIVIASGYGERPAAGKPAKGYPTPLANWVCRSSDGGKTWTHTETVKLPQDVPALIPYGEVIRRPHGVLVASFYSGGKFMPADTPMADRVDSAYVLTSQDDGKTWGEPRLVGRNQNETALLALDDRRWLVASRTGTTSQTILFASDDDGKTWSNLGPLAEAAQIPAHLLRLADGRLLLTFGSRTKRYWGVGYRVSKDKGKTWSEPKVLVDLGKTADGGYPSSIQLPDGEIVTAYYSGPSDLHPRYYMGAAHWRVDAE